MGTFQVSDTAAHAKFGKACYLTSPALSGTLTCVASISAVGASVASSPSFAMPCSRSAAASSAACGVMISSPGARVMAPQCFSPQVCDLGMMRLGRSNFEPRKKTQRERLHLQAAVALVRVLQRDGDGDGRAGGPQRPISGVCATAHTRGFR